MHTPSPKKNHLRSIPPEDLSLWNDGDDDSDETLNEPHPEGLDEPWPYTFCVCCATADYSSSDN
jgi:hypothetical protein